MCQLMQTMMKEVLQRKVVGVRELLAAAMAVFSYQRRGAFRAVMRFVLRRQRCGCQWRQSFHWLGHPVSKLRTLYRECGGVFVRQKRLGAACECGLYSGLRYV